jgi:AsmA protein
MRLVLRIAFGLLALVVVVAIALAFAVAVLFEPKDYQPLLVEAVETATGRTFTVDGELGLKLFPCCGVALDGAVLGNPPGFPPGHFAKVEKAALSLRIWPLIARREVEVGSVTLDGLDVNLLRRADGRANWEFQAPDGVAAGTATGGAPPTSAFNVAGLEVRGGRISYRDEPANSAYTADEIALSTSAIAAGEPFDIAAALRLTDAADGTSARLKLKSSAQVADDNRITLTGPVLEITATGAPLAAKESQVKLTAASVAIASAATTRLDFAKLTSEFTLRRLQSPAGDLRGSVVAGTAVVEIGPSTEFEAPALDIDMELRGKDIPGETIAITGRLTALAVDLDKLRGGVEAMQFDLTGLGANAAVTGGGRFTDDGAEMNGRLKLEPVSPRSLLAVLNEPVPVTADPQALTRLSGTTAWKLQKNALALNKLQFELDQTRITGRLGLRDFASPVTTFDLKLDDIDLDRYLEPEAKPASGAPAGSATEAPTEIPLTTIRALQLDGRLQVARLIYDGAKLSAVSMDVRAADGRLRLDPLTMQLYGGKMRGSIAVDATGDQARISSVQQWRGVRVGGLLKDVYQTDRVTGALSGQFDATGSGRTDVDLLQSLDGSVSMSLADGVYRGMDVWHEIRNARAKLRGNPPLLPPANPQTPINALEITGTIHDGVMRSERLLAEIPFLRINGNGALDLAGETLDYSLRAQVFETPVFADRGNLDDLTGLTIPFSVKGPMDGPKVSVDLKNLAKDVAIQKGTQRLLEKLGLGEPDGASSGQSESAQPQQREKAPAEKPRDALKRGLRDLLKR